MSHTDRLKCWVWGWLEHQHLVTDIAYQRHRLPGVMPVTMLLMFFPKQSI